MFENDPLQSTRIKKRFERLQDWYASEVVKIKRGREGCPGQFNLEDHKESTQNLARDLKIKWGWDMPLLKLKLISNWDFAIANKNRYLMREGIYDFPIMNYTLGEGPFKVSAEAVMGPEDRHVVIQGDDRNLIYFKPDQDRLATGIFVECLL